MEQVCTPSFQELLGAELRLDPRQWGPAPRREAVARGKRDTSRSVEDVAAAARGSEAVLEVDCLVHEEWVRGATTGVLPPPHVPPLPAEEIHWLLQPSCDCPTPQHWLRVSILCLQKALEPDPHAPKTSKRFLIPQERGYSKTSIHELLTQISQENLLASWQEVLQSVHPTPSTGHRLPTNSYVHEVVHKLYHTEIQTIQQGPMPPQKRKHSTPQESPTTVLSLRPGVRDQNLSSNTTGVRGGREEDRETHSNLSPLLAALEGRRAFYLVFPYSRFTLLDIALHSPAMFNDSISKPLFVLFQLLKVLEHCHRVGVTLGALSLRNVFVDSRLWLQVRIAGENLSLVSSGGKEGERGEVCLQQESGRGGTGAVDGGRDLKVGRVRDRKKTRQWRERKMQESMDDSPSASLSTTTISDPECEAELSESAKDTSSESSPTKQLSVNDHGSLSSSESTVPDPPAIPLSEAVKLWQHGTLDNFTYLLLLNKHAGRRLGDANNHPIFPWVSDFSHPVRGLRDLTRSKFRLNKGDDQLNFTYSNARDEARRGPDTDSSPTPHHVGDILTDVTYYVYKARQTPRDVLCTHVRPRWVPEEYPASMEKMYMWTPDECIPEFFTDPLIFRSIHPDLPDLALPAWCDSPESFIAAHRQLLEGDYVSSQLHHWIDLTFGYKLSGEAAVRAKNVYVSLVDKHRYPKNHGIVQLFRASHPKRVQGGCTSVALLEWETYLGQSRVSNGASFPIDRQEMIARFVQGSSVVRRGSGGTAGGSGSRPKVRTLESIVEQQTQRERRDGQREGGGEGEEADGEGYPTEEPPHYDSSFEQIPFPNASFSSNTPSGFPNISYTDSPMDPPLPPPTLSSQQQQQQQQQGKTPVVRFKESAVLNSTQTQPGGQRFRVAKYFRPRRQTQSEGSGEEYPWQGVEIGFPRESHVLQGLAEQEERAHFVMRCCKDFGDSLGPAWEQTDLEELASVTNPPHLPPLLVLLARLDSDPLFTPSLEEKVMVDVAAVTATVVELCCIRELRVATRVHASLRERVEVIRQTLSSGQLRLPNYLRNLVELVLTPDTRRGVPSSTSHLSLPHLSPSLLLQPFLPVVSFPAYFEHLHNFASSLELLSRQAGLNRHHEPSLKSPMTPSPRENFDAGVVSKIMESVSENLHSLVASTAHGEGFVLLLLHLYPLFQYPQTSFEMVQMHLDTIGRHMSHAQMYRLFSSVLVHFFDSSLQPHQQGHLLSRWTADFLIRRFGLFTFLSKFLEFFLEAVLEPGRLSARGITGVRKSVFRLKESESVLTLLPQVSDVLRQSSLQYDEQKRQSVVSDFTFSVDLTEAGGGAGYQSEGDTSSGGDSEGELHPEASLLARSGVVLGSVGPAMYNIHEEEEEDRDEVVIEGPRERGEGSMRMMLLPQLSLGGQDTHDGQEQRKTQKSNKTARDVSMGDTDADREQDSSQSTGKIPKSSSANTLTAPLESPLTTSGITSTLNGELPTLEDSLPTLSTDSHSDPLTTHSTASRRTDGGESVKPSAVRREGAGFNVGEERRGEGRESWVGELEEGEGEGEGTVFREVEEEEESGEKKTSESRNDPETAAIDQSIAEVAGDTLCWLMRRLGPLLATCHVVSPLLNGIHRCFTGILGQTSRHGPALGCLTHMAELYGEKVLTKLYLPRVEGWVLSATNRMSVKAEANLAASLTLVRLITRQISDQNLEEVTSSLCEGFFIPLIQLLSSQTVFPSGGQARATVCHSLILLLLQTGRRLGREKSLNLLLETLRLFFTSFDGVYTMQSEDAASRGRSESAATSVMSSHNLSTQTSAPGKLRGSAAGSAAGDRGRAVSNFAESARLPDSRKATFIHQKKKTVSLEEQASATTVVGGTRATKDFVRPKPLKTSPSTQDMALEQLQETFTPAMAHATYIPFCKLLGQIKVNMELRNTELIEHMAYSYDDRTREETRSLPSVFLPSEDDLSSSDSGSEDSEIEDTARTMDEDLVRDVTIRLGPVAAMQQKRGLAGDAVSFGRPSWFVDLQQEVVGGELGGASSLAPGEGSSGVDRGNESLVATTGVSSGGGGGAGGVSGSGVSGLGEAATRSVVVGVGEEGGGGGKGWMEGVRGSAMATASGILGLIQNRPTSEMPQGRGSKVNDLTRHSINFDMKFQSVMTSQQQQTHSNQSSFDTSVEEADSHLAGQWSELWESRLHQSPHHQESYSQFLGKKLQIYTGHKGSVRSLAVSDSEHFFLSASKDRTVKLWLLRNQGGGSAQIPAHLTYSQHQKPVSHVELVSTTGDIISCDGTVHLWDPEFGHTIHQYSSPRGREFLAMTTLLPPQQVAVVVTSDPALRFIDFRTHSLQHTWKISPNIGSLVKCLSCGDNWVAVGSTGGTVSTLDLRMGGLLHQWRPSDFNLVPTTTWNENLFQLLPTRHGNLVTSVGAGTLHLWRPSTGKLLSHIRGQSSTTPCLDYMGDQLVSASSNGVVVVHNSFEQTKDPSSTLFWVTKVKNRELKGGVVSMATLQEKRLLLLGSENGQVVLMS